VAQDLFAAPAACQHDLGQRVGDDTAIRHDACEKLARGRSLSSGVDVRPARSLSLEIPSAARDACVFHVDDRHDATDTRSRPQSDALGRRAEHAQITAGVHTALWNTEGTQKLDRAIDGIPLRAPAEVDPRRATKPDGAIPPELDVAP